MKNTKKKMLNLVELIMQVVLMISYFIIPSIRVYSYGPGITYTVWDYCADFGEWLGFILLLFSMVNIIMCLVSVFGNATDKDGKSHIVMPLINLIVGYPLLTLTSNADGNVIDIDTAYVIVAFLLLIAIVVLSIVKRTSVGVQRVEDDEQLSSSNVSEGLHNANKDDLEDLKKLKELLDMGAITQEEFDAKKKELLGL